MFRYKVMNSTYFKPEGNQSLAEVLREFGEPLKLATVYMHMARHQESDLMNARKRYKSAATQDPTNPTNLPVLAGAVEGEVVSQGEHEQALDAFIKEGYNKLRAREMNITATNFLAAIKIKSDNEKNTKDRRMDMIKSFFSGKKDETKTV